jgi:hypothetical protein
MLYNKIFTNKIVEDLDDVRDYLESGLMKAAIARLNLIKKDIIRASDTIQQESKIKGKLTPVKKLKK